MNTMTIYDRVYRKGRVLRKLGMLDPRIPRAVRARAIRDYRENRRVTETSTARVRLPDDANELARAMTDGRTK